MEGIFELQQVSYEYESAGGRKRAVCNLDFLFEKQKMYAIVGKSGAGKSTLLSMLSGMKKPTSGKILYCGEDLAQMDLEEYRRKDISLIHQAYHLFPRLTALENVCYPLELLGMALEQAERIAGEKLKEVGISEQQLQSYPLNLSGGEQQRVAIARALAKGAKILLADEPTGNLDGENTERIMQLLRKLVEEGYCVIIVTHDDEVAKQVDCVLQMDDGKLMYNERVTTAYEEAY